MKNLLIFEESWARISDGRPWAGLQPVLFHRDDPPTINGAPTRSPTIHAAWLNFDFGFDRIRPFVDLLLQSDDLEFVQTAAAGLDSRMFKALAAKPIRLCNSDAQAPAIAEYVLAAILFRMHRFDQRLQLQQRHQWTRHPFRELGGCRCLLVGYGYIGSRIATRLKSFGAHVSVIRRKRELPAEADRVGTLEDFSGWLPDADVVILAAALNEGTRNLLDGSAFDRFKPGAILVNIARGGLVDETALRHALDSGRVSFAILDVFQSEPLPGDHPFWQDDRVLVTAHTASAGSDRQARGDQLMIDNLERYLAGWPLRNQVDLSSIR